jgi:hypothetical protein
MITHALFFAEKVFGKHFIQDGWVLEMFIRQISVLVCGEEGYLTSKNFIVLPVCQWPKLASLSSVNASFFGDTKNYFFNTIDVQSTHDILTDSPTPGNKNAL